MRKGDDFAVQPGRRLHEHTIQQSEQLGGPKRRAQRSQNPQVTGERSFSQLRGTMRSKRPLWSSDQTVSCGARSPITRTATLERRVARVLRGAATGVYVDRPRLPKSSNQMRAQARAGGQRGAVRGQQRDGSLVAHGQSVKQASSLGSATGPFDHRMGKGPESRMRTWASATPAPGVQSTRGRVVRFL